MKQSVDFHTFDQAFRELSPDNFSYEGRHALFEYIEEFEDSTGEEIEFDVIALCCDFAEYGSLIDAASQYFDFEGMSYGEDGEELETPEEVEEKAREFLQDRTTVIEFDAGVIIQNF
mgnify:CR=1 FL=1